MNPQQEQAPRRLLNTVGILHAALAEFDGDKSHEAVSVLLMQTMNSFGMEHPVFQQFFPVMDRIQRQIASDDLAGALHQTDVFQAQLLEVKEMVMGNA